MPVIRVAARLHSPDPSDRGLRPEDLDLPEQVRQAGAMVGRAWELLPPQHDGWLLDAVRTAAAGGYLRADIQQRILELDPFTSSVVAELGYVRRQTWLRRNAVQSPDPASPGKH